MCSRTLRAEATGVAHLMTHMPKHPKCPICMRAKPQRKQCRGGALGPRPDNFAQQLTADTLIACSEQNIGLDDEANGLVMTDRATTWLDCFPTGSRSADDAYESFVEFAGENRWCGKLHTDGAAEFVKAAKDHPKI